MRELPRLDTRPPNDPTMPVTGANGGSAVVSVVERPVTVLPVPFTTWPTRLITGVSSPDDEAGGVVAG